MIKILHIPTGHILDMPSYLHFKWLFNLRSTDFNERGDHNLKAISGNRHKLLDRMIEQLDKYHLLDSPDDYPPTHIGVTYYSGLRHLQKKRGIEEFEVLCG